MSVIIDKLVILRPPEDPEDIYRGAVTRAINHCVKRHRHLNVWLDKRYTNPTLRDRLEQAIRAGITDISQQVVLLRQEDSQKYKGLQAVDHIAWAIYQKYERGKQRFWELIRHRIIVEEVIEHHLW